VKEDADGWLSIDYAEIVPILIEAFKEHMQDYHKMQASFRQEFEAFKSQVRERTDKNNVDKNSSGDADDASHESGDDEPTTTGKRAKAKSGKSEEKSEESDEEEGEGDYELEEMAETRTLADLSFRSKLDVKELADRMASLIPPRPYNELLHTLRTDKRKKKVKQRYFSPPF
jgi:hypothetical protein